MLKKLAQTGLLLAMVFVTCPSSQAGILVEPILGYNTGAKFEFPEESGEDVSGGKGLGYGARIGYQKIGFQIGVDYLKSSLDMDDKNLKDDVTLSEWAAFVGYEFPILLRVYAGYIFSANGETKLSSGEKYELLKGTGTKFGVGFTGLPFVDLNLEYRSGTFDEIKVLGIKAKGPDYSSVLLSVSLPMVF